MGGCLDQPKPHKPRSTKPGQVRPAPNTKKESRMTSSLRSSQARLEAAEPKVQAPKPKKQLMTINQLLTTYCIESTLELSSKMEGPKYLSNLVDGSGCVLRVYEPEDINKQRFAVYQQILDLQVFENEEKSLMVLDQYCSGLDIFEIVEEAAGKDLKQYQQKLLKFVSEVYDIIKSFHGAGIYLGNLAFSSFRESSIFGGPVRLVDFNMKGEVGEYQLTGFAHQNNKESDFQFFGYLLQFILSEQSPVFIAHKIQYASMGHLDNYSFVEKLLKGVDCNGAHKDSIVVGDVIVNKEVALGYKFRRDVNKLLFMRRKRKAHNRRLYGEDMGSVLGEKKFQEELVYRLQTDRILTRILQYIQQLHRVNQQPFMEYAGNNDKFKQLKEVFLIKDKGKKMQELKECLTLIR